MTGLLLSRQDIRFQLYDWLGVESLLHAPRFAAHSRETFEAVIDGCERLADDVLAPCLQLGDRNEPRFDGDRVELPGAIANAVRAIADSGLIAAVHDEAVGGMQLPVVVDKAAQAFLYAANIGACAYPMLTIGNASLLLAHGTQAQVDAFAMPQLRGEWTGTMCLSEPQAGSSLSDITTRGEYECESPFGPQYRLSGRKMWISGGEHEILGNIVHLVLAKLPDAEGRLPPGTKGISLFIVPRTLVDEDGNLTERNDVSLAGLNHKLGYRAAVNCALNFGEGRFTPQGKGGAIGYLVGKPGEGLACMFHMMNEARIGVGLGAVALGYTAYLHALDYARNRPQAGWRVHGRQHGRPVHAAVAEDGGAVACADPGLPGLRQQAAHADVDAPVQHVRVQAAGSALHQGQLHIGKTLGEGLQGLAEEFRQRDRAGIAYDQLAGRAGSQFGGDVLCKPGVFQRCAGIRQKVLALGGQCDRATGAVEQAKAKLGFQSRDLPRQRRLGKVQALGRTAEVQLFGDRQEVT